MSLGKPVVASTTGGIPEVVVHGETGLLVPPSDSRALAEAICEVLENTERRRALGEAGRRRAEFFTFERMMDGYESVYKRICNPESVAHRLNDEEVADTKTIAY
jgi:glycosyltransferase involved in cell wall biosynthesis